MAEWDPGKPTATPNDEGESEEHDPEIRESDRFTISRRPMPFTEFVAATMSQVPERDPATPAQQPRPEAWEVIWLSRMPAEEGRGGA